MRIDWLTVAAQVVNFLVLVWLLRRFLYRPVLAAMAARQAGIAKRLEAVAASEAATDRRARALREREADFERERTMRTAALERDVLARREQLLEDARTAVDDAARRWRESVVREREAFDERLRDDLAGAIVEAAGRCVAMIADADLDARASARFVAALDALDPALGARLAGAADVVVATAAPVAGDAVREARWQAAIAARIGADARLSFVHQPALLLGAELRAPGVRVGWAAAEVLDAARARIRERLDAVVLPGASAPGDTRPPA
ncbi:MAG: hypothetical protein AB7P21_08865 [Lautropia sp.]